MSWKTFSLRRKNTLSDPTLLGASDQGKSLKRGDDKRLLLLTMVKEGKLSVDTAMQRAYGMGIASVPYEQLDEGRALIHNPTGAILNFGVYRYGRNNKTVKCILQIDCQENSLSLIENGKKQSTYSFLSVGNVDTAEDTTSLFIQFDDATEVEVDAGSYEEKNKIARALRSVIAQTRDGLPFNEPFVQRSVVKEGLLEKRGRSAAFLLWSKRFVRICGSEIMYFRQGEEENESSALSIIPLKNDTFVKKIVDNGFTLITDRKEYTFRVPALRREEQTEKERDDWILAIQEASKPRLDSPEQHTKAPFEQEKYLKNVVNSLNEELEQLGVMLNIIDAPIRASTQVKKVREIVSSLNDEITTGMLSWTIRNEARKQLPNHSQCCNGRYCHDETKEHNENPLSGNYYNQFDSSNYYNRHHPNPNYSHIEADQDYQIEDAYDMLNLSQLQYKTTMSLDRTCFASQFSHGASNGSIATGYCDDYAKVSKGKVFDNNPYYNLQRSYFEEGNQIPDLPPKLNDDVEYRVSNDHEPKNVYIEHSLKTSDSESAMMMPIDDNLNLSKRDSLTDDNSSTPSSAPPPPPPPGGSIPPPPPLPTLFTPILPEKPDRIPICRMKPLFWSKVPVHHVTTSVWKDMEDKLDMLNVGKLEKLFCVIEQEKETKAAKTTCNVDKNTRPVKKTLLNPRKAQNFGIFLSGSKLDGCEIEIKLSIVDEDLGLSSEQISALKRFQPTTEEIEMYKSYKGTLDDLPDVDQFMMTLSNIPQLSSRLDILLTLREMPDQYKGIELPISNLLAACKNLHESATFPRLVEYILSVGNFLNGGTTRGRAYGFKLEALTKLVDIRSADKKQTLLQFVAEELYESDPDCLFCYKETSTLLLPIDTSIKGLVAEVEIMKRDLKNTEKHIKELKASCEESFFEHVYDFANEYEVKISQLQSKCDEANGLSLALKQKFGEHPSSDFQNWFNSVSTFMKQLQRAAEGVGHKKRRSILQQKNDAAPTVQIESAPVVKNADHETNAYFPYQKGHHKITLMNETSPEVVSQADNINVSNAYEAVVMHTTSQQQDNTDPKTSFKGLPSSALTVKHAFVIESNKPDIDNEEEQSFPTKIGYLEKLSGGKKQKPKWDHRFFEVTSSGYLCYSKKKKGKLSGAICLRGLPIVLDARDTCVLCIQQGTRTWQLRAYDDLEILDWYNVIVYYAQMGEINQ